MLSVLFATFGAVFLAEIVGDKLLYTTGVLASRYRTAPVMLGMALAFTLKMGVAVLVGTAIARLPRLLVAGVTAASFIGVAVALWRKPVEIDGERREHTARKAALVSFATIFLSEWGDVGQITAATMSARFGQPLVVWVGAVSAMVLKGVLAASVGAGVRGWIRSHVPPRAVRVCGVALMLILGLLSVVETLTGEF
ncbi:MAG: TMEM165/GDT1 family protein [Acidobacteria bacterium]|nr:TMEM165/GDT1 family protein [Acidobacteriota bacterium]